MPKNSGISFDIQSKIISELDNYDHDLVQEPFPTVIYKIFQQSSSCDQFLKKLNDAQLCDKSLKEMFTSLYDKVDRMRGASISCLFFYSIFFIL